MLETPQSRLSDDLDCLEISSYCYKTDFAIFLLPAEIGKNWYRDEFLRWTMKCDTEVHLAKSNINNTVKIGAA